MTTLQNLNRLDDHQLIVISTVDPESEEGRTAEAVLRHRQYLTTKAYNRLLVVLTVALAVCALIQALSAGIQTWLVWRSRLGRSAGEGVSSTRTAGEGKGSHLRSAGLSSFRRGSLKGCSELLQSFLTR